MRKHDDILSGLFDESELDYEPEDIDNPDTYQNYAEEMYDYNIVVTVDAVDFASLGRDNLNELQMRVQDFAYGELEALRE